MEQQKNIRSKPTDAIEMLKAAHQKVQTLFRSYENTSDRQRRHTIAEHVFEELELHTQLEENVFYPAFAEEADEAGKRLVADSLQEHQMVKDLIEELRDLDPEDPEFDAKFRELMQNVQHHVEEEEGEMFPEAEEVLEEQIEDMMDKMRELKKQLLAT